MKRIIALAGGLLIAAPALLAQPIVTIDGDTVAARGVTPGGAVALAVAGHRHGGWLAHSVHFQTVVTDDDADGAVTFTRKTGIPETSIAVVIDVATGALAAASPAGLPEPRPRELPAAAKDVGPSGLLQLAESAARLDVLLVTPAEGAWAGSIFDGDRLDADASADGAVTVAFASLAPLGATARDAAAARAGDVLVLVDPTTLRYAAARLAAKAR